MDLQPNINRLYIWISFKGTEVTPHKKLPIETFGCFDELETTY